MEAAQVVPADGVVVIWAEHGDLQRHAPAPERGAWSSFHLDDERIIPLVTGISGSGPGTYTGTERSPVPIAEIIAPDGKARMILYVILASSDDWFITRSGLAWSGDPITGVTVAGRMYDRHMGGKDRVGEMTAELHVGVPGRDDVAFLFVSYNAKGQRITAFGRRPFAASVQAIQEGHNDGTR